MSDEVKEASDVDRVSRHVRLHISSLRKCYEHPTDHVLPVSNARGEDTISKD